MYFDVAMSFIVTCNMSLSKLALVVYVLCWYIYTWKSSLLLLYIYTQSDKIGKVMSVMLVREIWKDNVVTCQSKNYSACLCIFF